MAGPASTSGRTKEDAVPTTWYRTIWLSDVHLGTRGSKAQALLDFLDTHDCDYLYLVGDTIDLWRLKRAPYWPQLHSDVIRKILSKARAGAAVTFIPGNHDEYVRRFCGLQHGNILVREEAVHVTADGRSLLVIHGDEVEGVTRPPRCLGGRGPPATPILLVCTRCFTHPRRILGFGYWSLSAYVKWKIKRAVSFVADFEASLAHEATRRAVQGVICGHIHKA